MAVWRKPSNVFDTPGFTLITRSFAGRVSLGTAEETVLRQSEETHIRPMTERASLEAYLKKRFLEHVLCEVLVMPRLRIAPVHAGTANRRFGVIRHLSCVFSERPSFLPL